MALNRKLKATIALLIITLSVKSSNQSKEVKTTYNDFFKINGCHTFATYKGKDIIIGSKYFIESQKKDDNNIYIIDERFSTDPDLSICESHQIYSLKAMKDIIDILMEYEKRYPTKWDRTYDSMLKEWLIHNICYYLNHERERTRQVDFDNSDELLYINLRTIIEELLNNQLDEIIADELDKQKTKELTK
jgi:hypothetical protein